MDPNLSLTSIEFACKDDRDAALSSVRVNYSDGQTQLFENTITHAYDSYQTINFDANVPISSVSGSDMTTATSAITFYDSAGVIAYQYRPYD